MGGDWPIWNGDDCLETWGHRFFQAVDPVGLDRRDGKSSHNRRRNVVWMGLVAQRQIQKPLFGDMDSGHGVGCGNCAYDYRRAAAKSSRERDLIDKSKAKFIHMARELSIVLVKDGDEHIVPLDTGIVCTLSFDRNAKKFAPFDTHDITQIQRKSQRIKSWTQIGTGGWHAN